MVAVVLLAANSVYAQHCAFITRSGATTSEVAALDLNRGIIAKHYPLEENPTGIVVDSDGNRLFVTQSVEHGGLVALDATTGHVLKRVPVGPYPAAVALSPDHGTIYVSNSDQTVSQVDIDANSVRNISLPQRSRGLLHTFAFGPSGNVFVGTCPPGICVLDPAEGNVADTITVQVVPDPDVTSVLLPRTLLFAAVRSGEVRETVAGGVVVISPTSGEMATIDTTEWPSAIAVDRNEEMLYAAMPCHRSPHCDTARLSIYRVSNRTFVDSVFVGKELADVAVTADETTVVVTDPDSGVFLVNTLTRATEKLIDAPEVRAIALADALECRGTESPTATPTALPVCPGDCDHSGTITIAELTRGVLIALGQTVPDLCGLDRDGDGKVAIYELIAAVAAALGTCEPSS